MDRTNPVFRSQLHRIETIADRLDNMDTLAAECAAENLVHRKPAFWSTATYHNQTGTHFRAALCRLGSIEATWRELRAHFEHSGKDVESVHLLDALLPLNDAAIVDLQNAYDLVGSFRTKAELQRRADRAEGFEIGRAA